MATKFQFGGRRITLPGVYSQIKSGRNNPTLDSDYGIVLIIASAPGQVRGGVGISGTNESGKDAIYEIRDLLQLQEFIGGTYNSKPYIGKVGEILFKPNRFDPGCSRVLLVKPFTTTPATYTLDLTSGSNGGKLVFKTRDEGLAVNGTLHTVGSDDYLIAGYSYTIEAGERDSSKWIMKFWVSTYKGDFEDVDNSIPYDEVNFDRARPRLIAKSIEFDNMTDLLDWAQSNKDFTSYFIYDDVNSSVKGTGVITALEIGAIEGYQIPSVLSTESEVSGDFDKTLEALQDVDFNFVMYVSGDDVESDTNTIKLVSFLETSSKYNRFLVVGASNDTLTDSIATAQAFNSDKVIAVHSAIKKRSQLDPKGYRVWDSHYHAAYITGRLAGLPPQVPITFKAIEIDGLVSKLNVLNREDALDAGVLVTNWDADRGLYIVEQGINTLQDNDFTLNPDATSHVIQIKRIAAQLNKEIVVNAKRDLLANPVGVNRNTLSEKDVSDWLKGYLERKIATDDVDNLILSFSDITVTRQEDAYFVTYKFEPNSEIRIVFFTGFML